jgi:hypothetical protein
LCRAREEETPVQQRRRINYSANASLRHSARSRGIHAACRFRDFARNDSNAEEHRYVANTIRIEGSANVQKAWLLFTPEAMTVAKLEAYKKDPDARTDKGSAIMQSFSPAAWKQGQREQPHALRLGQLNGTVAELIAANLPPFRIDLAEPLDQLNDTLTDLVAAAQTPFRIRLALGKRFAKGSTTSLGERRYCFIASAVLMVLITMVEGDPFKKWLNRCWFGTDTRKYDSEGEEMEEFKSAFKGVVPA